MVGQAIDVPGIGLGIEAEPPCVRFGAVALGHGELGGIDRGRKTFGGEVHERPFEDSCGHRCGRATGNLDKTPQGGQQGLTGPTDLAQSGHAQLGKSTSSLGSDVLNGHTGDHEIELDGVHSRPRDLNPSFRERSVVGEFNPLFVRSRKAADDQNKHSNGDSDSHANPSARIQPGALIRS